MIVEEDIEYKNNMMNKLKKFFSFNRREIHVSDLVYCLRKAYFRRINGSTVTDEQVLHFIRGQSLHALLEKLYPQNEIIVMYDGFFGTMDAFDPEKDAVVELKTVQEMYSVGPYEHHLKQLQYYLTMTDKRIGYLIYLILGQKELKVFRVTLTDEDVEDLRKELKKRKALLERALAEKNFEILPVVTDWQCRYCEFYDICVGKKEKEKEEEE